jgi:hypothetical protein
MPATLSADELTAVLEPTGWFKDADCLCRAVTILDHMQAASEDGPVSVTDLAARAAVPCFDIYALLKGNLGPLVHTRSKDSRISVQFSPVRFLRGLHASAAHVIDHYLATYGLADASHVALRSVLDKCARRELPAHLTSADVIRDTRSCGICIRWRETIDNLLRTRCMK